MSKAFKILAFIFALIGAIFYFLNRQNDSDFYDEQ